VSEIALFAARAAALATEGADLCRQSEIDTRVLDEAVQTAREALPRLQATKGRIAELSDRSRAGQVELEAACRTNGLLQGTPKPERPRFPKIEVPAAVDSLEVVIRRLPLPIGARDSRLHGTVAAFLGIAGPDQARLAAMATEAKLAALGDAELNKIASNAAAFNKGRQTSDDGWAGFMVRGGAGR
jgi:hypothetical protein